MSCKRSIWVRLINRRQENNGKSTKKNWCWDSIRECYWSDEFPVASRISRSSEIKCVSNYTHAYFRILYSHSSLGQNWFASLKNEWHSKSRLHAVHRSSSFVESIYHIALQRIPPLSCSSWCTKLLRWIFIRAILAICCLLTYQSKLVKWWIIFSPCIKQYRTDVTRYINLSGERCI